MSEAKHTPGPWGVPDEGTLHGRVTVSAGRPGAWNGLIAECDAGNYARSQSEGLANAALIARAPEMADELARLRAENERLTTAARSVLADHEERAEIYGIKETQPNRVRVMAALRAALHPTDTEAGQSQDPPVCEECNLDMHRCTDPATGNYGWSCDGCGWSQDTSGDD